MFEINTLTDDVYSTRCTLGQLLEHEETKVIIRKNLAELAPEVFKVASTMIMIGLNSCNGEFSP